MKYFYHSLFYKDFKRIIKIPTQIFTTPCQPLRTSSTETNFTKENKECQIYNVNKQRVLVNLENIRPEEFPISLTGDGFNYKQRNEWKRSFINYFKNDKTGDDEDSLPKFLKLLDSMKLELLFENNYPRINKLLKELKTQTMEIVEIPSQEKNHFYPFKNKHFLSQEPSEITIPKAVENKINSYKQMGERLVTFLKSRTDPRDIELQEEIDYFRDNICRANYSHPDSSIPKSKVACGGCGAFLHCQDYSLPGFMPKDKFILLTEGELRGELCQRCLYIKTLNVALKLNVNTKDYPRIISHIHKQTALIILMVDIIDFPNSIWPGIFDIISHNQPIFIVANKVDLLPNDNFEENKPYLERVEIAIWNYLKENNLDRGHNIKHVALISAKTGFGVEELITKLQSFWHKKGHVYLLGSVNVGKSSLFNALLQSDYCKSSACDMIQRATVSPWPGTTLNLLKFPIMQPSEWELKLRSIRLNNIYRKRYIEQYLRKSLYFQTRNPKYLTLIGRIGMTFRKDFKNYEDEEKAGIEPLDRREMSVSKYLNLAKPDKRAFFCYDTPGTVFENQILDLLTTDEVQKSVPNEMILPRHFNLLPGHSLFIAGLARIDLKELVNPKDNTNPRQEFKIRASVFCSRHLPINIVLTKQADLFYGIYIQTGLLVVPDSDPNRLRDFPPLKGQQFNITGTSWRESAADIVISSTGWVALTTAEGWKAKLNAFTPEGRGLYLRSPPLLQFAINHKYPLKIKHPTINKTKNFQIV